MLHSFRRARFHALVVLALAGWALLAVSCNRSSFVEIVQQTTYLGVPQSVDCIVNIDVNRLRLSENFSRFESALQAKPEIGTLLKNIREKAKFDLLRDLDYLTLAVPAGTGLARLETNGVILAKGNFENPAEKLEALRNWLGEDYLIAPPPFKEGKHEESGFTTYQLAAQSQYNESIVHNLRFAFPTPHLMVFSEAEPQFIATLSVIAGKEPGVQKDEAWARRLSRPNLLGATFWTTGSGDYFRQMLQGGPAAAMTGGSLGTARDFFFNLDTLPDYQLGIGFDHETGEGARKMTEDFNKGVAGLKQALAMLAPVAPEIAKLPEKIVVLQEVQESKMLLRLTPAQVRTVVEEQRKLTPEKLAPLLPGMMSAPKP